METKLYWFSTSGLDGGKWSDSSSSCVNTTQTAAAWAGQEAGWPLHLVWTWWWEDICLIQAGIKIWYTTNWVMIRNNYFIWHGNLPKHIPQRPLSIVRIITHTREPVQTMSNTAKEKTITIAVCAVITRSSVTACEKRISAGVTPVNKNLLTNTEWMFMFIPGSTLLYTDHTLLQVGDKLSQNLSRAILSVLFNVAVNC